MKKILYFIPTFSNISETFILREVSQLIEFGNLDIQILSLKEGNAKLSKEVKDRTIYFRPRFFDLFLSFGFMILHLGNIIKASSLLKESEKGKFLFHLSLYLKSIIYASFISRLKVEHIHAHFMSDSSTLMMFVSEILKINFSISGHATDVVRDHDMVKSKVRRAKFISLCNSYAFKKCIELSGGKGRKNIILLYHGIDYLKFKFKYRRLDSSKRIEVITDARFVEKKGLSILSKAIINLNQILDVRLTIIGVLQNKEQENYKVYLESLFKESGLENKINIPNNGKGLDQDQVANYYDSSDIFIYAGVDTGTGDIDGIPNVLLQAGFSGLPIITTLSGSISDLFDDTNSYIIEQNSTTDLELKFQELIKDKNRDLKSERLYNQVGKEFSLFLNTKELEENLKK